jgi:hypothetical protein
MSDQSVDVWRKFFIRTWTDERVMALSRPTPNGQSLLVALIAGEQTGVVPGLFKIGERAFAEQLRWPLHAGESLLEDLPKGLPKGFREAFEEVSAQGFVKADWNARLVFVPGAIWLDPPSNPNMILKWRKAWRELPECELKDEAEQAFKSFFERYSKGFQEAFAKVCGNGSRNQDSGFRKQKAGERESKKAPAPEKRSALPKVGDGATTLGEAQALTVSKVDAVALFEHWRSEHQRVRRSELPLQASDVQLEAAKTLLVQAHSDMSIAQRAVTALVESDEDWVAERQWRLTILNYPEQCDRYITLASMAKTPKRVKASTPGDDSVQRREAFQRIAEENMARLDEIHAERKPLAELQAQLAEQDPEAAAALEQLRGDA